MHTRIAGVLAALCLVLTCQLADLALASEKDHPPIHLGEWSILPGQWSMDTSLYAPDGRLTESQSGSTVFSPAPSPNTIIEHEHTVINDNPVEAIHLIAFDETHSIELARTDSEHAGITVWAGRIEGNTITLEIKHPNPSHTVTRRKIYTLEDDDHFTMSLEFSRDGGASWFTRMRSRYSRILE